LGRKRIEDADLPTRPGEERDFVDRDDPRRPIGFARCNVGERRREVGKPSDEVVAEDIDIVGPAVMQYVPQICTRASRAACSIGRTLEKS
jgi:hypothetical protein